MQHDSRYKYLFSHPEFVQELIVGFLPSELAEDAVLDSLERVNASFVSPGMKRREGDVIWKLRLKNGSPLYLYLLLEFQSTVQRAMPVRMLQYVAMLYEHLIREEHLDLDQGLPPVLPVVLYNGNPRWHAPCSLDALVKAPDYLQPWQPKFEFLLLDEGAYDRNTLEAKDLFLAAIFELDGPAEVESITAAAQKLAKLWQQHPLSEEVGKALKAWIIEALEQQQVGPDKIEELTKGDIRMFGEKFVLWEQQTLQKGLEKGLQEGLQKGLEKGREQGLQEAAINLYRNGLDPEFIARSLKLPLTKIKQWLEGTEH